MNCSRTLDYICHFGCSNITLFSSLFFHDLRPSHTEPIPSSMIEIVETQPTPDSYRIDVTKTNWQGNNRT